RSSEISIIQTRDDKLELPQETYSSDEDDFFDIYEEKDLEEVKSYHTDDTQTEDEEIETLDEKQQAEALRILQESRGLFASGLDELGQYQEI
ncbi:31751_t:CDS:2, partial [Racocetra persica]